MKQVVTAILLLIPMLGFGQVDSIYFPMYKDSLIYIDQTDTSIIQYGKDWFISSEPDKVIGFSTDTILTQPVSTFELYESLPCYIHSYIYSTPIHGVAIFSTIYTKIGKNGDWVPGGRRLVLIQKEDGTELEMDLNSCIISIK